MPAGVVIKTADNIVGPGCYSGCRTNRRRVRGGKGKVGTGQDIAHKVLKNNPHIGLLATGMGRIKSADSQISEFIQKVVGINTSSNFSVLQRNSVVQISKVEHITNQKLTKFHRKFTKIHTHDP